MKPFFLFALTPLVISAAPPSQVSTATNARELMAAMQLYAPGTKMSSRMKEKPNCPEGRATTEVCLCKAGSGWFKYCSIGQECILTNDQWPTCA